MRDGHQTVSKIEDIDRRDSSFPEIEEPYRDSVWTVTSEIFPQCAICPDYSKCFFAGCGTIYGIATGLGPFVTFVHNSGTVGQSGGILGQGFTGTTSVSINGISAAFTVVSDTFLEATVPVGATTGYVTVTTPSGTLTSNVPFYVIL